MQFKPGVKAEAWIAGLPEIASSKLLSEPLNAYLLRFDHSEFVDADVKLKMLRQPAVLAAQFNRFVAHRAIPNDAQFPQQWQYRNVGQAGGNEGADFNILSAWDVTTGGVTANGDTVVVCAIDNGIDTDHPDLVPNLWVNRDEIPGNGIDDDNNGYIDDYNGFSTVTDDNNIEGGPHGTSVAGIMAARGNNNLGVTGMSWNVKVMVVRNDFFASESEVLQAYSYALEARMDYAASNGTEGAFVVVTNASWGIDGGRPENSPVWCNLYDLLGEQGIISVGATTNTNTNVDEDGDLPTTCPSEYLIGVTNLNGLDEKVINAGFGATHIDLGAYGQQVFTTRNNATYGNFCCTSAAAPAVAGAIGLLYSAPSAAFGSLLNADPSAAALFIKDIVLDNVKPIPNLAGNSVTGGGLDVGASMAALMAIQNDCFAPVSISIATQGATGIALSWNTTNAVNSVDIRYRLVSAGNWQTITGVTSPYVIANLQSCGFYEVQLISNCAETTTASDIFTLETDGCCRRPANFAVTSTSTTTVILGWNAVLAANQFTVRLRPTGTTAWTEYPANTTSLGISSLSNCTEYEAEIKTDCTGENSGFGNRLTFLTRGCGACLDAEYCVPNQPDNSEEWIAEFNFANRFVNNSGAAPGGYISYGELPGSEVVPGGVYPLTLKPAHAGNSFTEAFRVYADWNQNGFFNSTEVAGEGISNESQPITINITVPANTPVGQVRLRVVMQFLTFGSSCGLQVRPGETEDYCLRVVANAGCVPPQSLTAVYREDTESVKLSWPASLAPGGAYLLRYRRRTTMQWTEIATTNLSVVLSDFTFCDLFDAEIASVCDGVTGSFATTIFNSCSSTNDRSIDPNSWSISPNPARDLVYLNWSGAASLQTIMVYNLHGQLQLQQTYRGEPLDISALPAGIYLCRIRSDDGKMGVKRLIKG